MQKLTIMLLMMFLALGASSCGSTQKIVCEQVRQLEVKPIPACDISFQFNRCRCRCFDFNTWDTLPLNSCKEFQGMEGNAVNFELTKCEGLSGFFVEDMTSQIRPNVKGLATIKSDYCD